MHTHKATKLRIGWIVAIVLAVLTALEYWIAIRFEGNVIPWLAIIALLKAWLIVQYFMHVSQLWHAEKGEH